MDFTANEIAFWSGVIVFSFAVLGAITVILQRYLTESRTSRELRWDSRWKPILVNAIVVTEKENQLDPTREEWLNRLGLEPEVLESMGTKEREFLVQKCTEFMNEVDSTHHQGIQFLINQLELDSVAREMARDSRNLIRKIEGLKAVGFMGLQEAWDEAAEAAYSAQVYLAVAGTQVLIRLNPTRGLPILLDQYATREGFPLSQALSVLELVPSEELTLILREKFSNADEAQQIRLAPLLRLAVPGSVRPFIHNKLEDPDTSPELMTRLIRVLGTFGHPDDEDVLVDLMEHEFPPVRIQTAQALGELGSDRSKDVLEEALGDPVWWVRYRSAQALVGMAKKNNLSVEDLHSLAEEHDDPFARDSLERVMVEEEVA